MSKSLNPHCEGPKSMVNYNTKTGLCFNRRDRMVGQCEKGFELRGNKCFKDETRVSPSGNDPQKMLIYDDSAPYGVTCPDGYISAGTTTCYKDTRKTACPAGYVYKMGSFFANEPDKISV